MFSENGINRLKCSYEICTQKRNRLLDCSSMEWSWKDDDYYPFSINREKQYFDFFSLRPVICIECYMCSVDLTHFNILDNTGSIALRSTIDIRTKQLLSRSISRRKRIIETSNQELSFLCPRDQTASYYAYLLAEDCLRIAAINKSYFNPYMIGYIKFLSLKYCKEEEKEIIFKDCHTWLSQALSNNAYSNPINWQDLLYGDAVFKNW